MLALCSGKRSWRSPDDLGNRKDDQRAPTAAGSDCPGGDAERRAVPVPQREALEPCAGAPGRRRRGAPQARRLARHRRGSGARGVRVGHQRIILGAGRGVRGGSGLGVPGRRVQQVVLDAKEQDGRIGQVDVVKRVTLALSAATTSSFGTGRAPPNRPTGVGAAEGSERKTDLQRQSASALTDRSSGWRSRRRARRRRLTAAGTGCPSR